MVQQKQTRGGIQWPTLVLRRLISASYLGVSVTLVSVLKSALLGVLAYEITFV